MTPPSATELGRLSLILSRRWRPMAGVAAIGTIAGVLLVASLPPAYQARAVVRIDDPRPSPAYVAPTIAEPVDQRLRSRRIAFLARPIVEAAAERAGLLRAGSVPARREAIIDAAAARLDARPEGDDTFVLTFVDEDPVKARAFLQALVEIYAARRAGEAAHLAAATAGFFGRELDALRPRVALAEAAVERFRLERYGALPDQLEANLRMLEETRIEAHSIRGSVDAALARRQALLLDAESPLRRQEEDAARAVTSARGRYAAESAEVRNLEAELARVRAERRHEERELQRRAGRGGLVRAADAEIARGRALLEALETREATLTARIAETARNGEALAVIALDRDLLRDRLRILLARHEEAALAATLEADIAGGARTAVVEPAWVASAPVRPARSFLCGLAVAAAVALAIAVGWLLDVADRRVRTVDDLRRIAGDVVLLGVVPPLGRTRDLAEEPCA